MDIIGSIKKAVNSFTDNAAEGFKSLEDIPGKLKKMGKKTNAKIADLMPDKIKSTFPGLIPGGGLGKALVPSKGRKDSDDTKSQTPPQTPGQGQVAELMKEKKDSMTTPKSVDTDKLKKALEGVQQSTAWASPKPNKAEEDSKD